MHERSPAGPPPGGPAEQSFEQVATIGPLGTAEIEILEALGTARVRPCAAGRFPRLAEFGWRCRGGRSLSDLFEGLLAGPPGGGPAGTRAGFRQRGRQVQKGPDVAYRLKIPFEDAVALEAAVRRPRRRQDSNRPEAPARSAKTAPRFALLARARKDRAVTAMRSSPSRLLRTGSTPGTGPTFVSSCR